ncbi:MAG: hypothetical protein NC433_13725 [Clostridiales bacterium]|nr:hypothetical protein [Clostridiales bacterium]
MERRFEFKAQNKRTMNRTVTGTSKIKSLTGYFPPDESILCLGRLKTLFGKPLYVTKDLDNQYGYCILATDKDGKEVYLQVYSGPSGPSIGGNHDADSLAAADELVEFVAAAEASDYEYEGYYLDGPCSVKYSVRNGVPTMEENELSDEEYQKAYKEIYG